MLYFWESLNVLMLFIVLWVILISAISLLKYILKTVGKRFNKMMMMTITVGRNIKNNKKK